MDEIPKSFVVDRKTWARGKKGGLLLSEDGEMCCLGFVSRQAGLSDGEICGIGTPDNVCSVGSEKLYKKLGLITDSDSDPDVLIDSEFCKKAMELNDSESIDDAMRESELAKLFCGHGLEIRFEG